MCTGGTMRDEINTADDFDVQNEENIRAAGVK